MKKRKTLGERRIIEIIQSRLSIMPEMPIPFGDDVSAYNLGDGRLAILKTDMLVSKTDVPPGMTLRQAARKAVVMNVSDFAAKGVRPLAILVSLGLPKNLTEKDIEELADGLNTGAREYDSYIIGGDTGEAEDTIISLSLFGTAKKSEVMLRSGAKPGDIVATTGPFGRPPAGLKILLGKHKVQQRTRKKLIDSVLMPKARLKEGLTLSRTEAVTASIDSSDGLAWSLHEIARASHVGFTIKQIPIAPEAEEFAEANKLDPSELALYGGEEYELIITIKPELLSRAEKAVEEAGGRLFPMGKAIAGRQILLEANGKRQPIEPRGYEHFKRAHRAKRGLIASSPHRSSLA